MKTPSFRMTIEPSLWLLVYLLVVEGFVLLSIGYLLSYSLWFFGLIVPLLLHGFYLCWEFKRSALNGGIQTLVFREGGWELFYPQSNSVGAELMHATVWPWLVVLSFRCQYSGKRQSLILFKGSLEGKKLRQLRIMLRHYSVYGSL